jgi:hypothetical protein
VRTDQIERLETLRDRLVERSLIDADPANWIAGNKQPGEMTREERGDAKWCRGLAVTTVALTMQVTRLLQNPQTGGAIVPDKPPEPGQPEPNEEETVEAEIQRYERAAAAVVSKAASRVAKR